ncbi:hypothetical protein V491_03522, partial [Pseudogymnoascus sp. VKM F-3775]
EKFYVQGLGLSVLYRSPPQGTHPDQHPEDLVMLGYPGGAWHLELVHGEGGSFPVPKPTEEDLLVLRTGTHPRRVSAASPPVTVAVPAVAMRSTTSYRPKVVTIEAT